MKKTGPVSSGTMNICKHTAYNMAGVTVPIFITLVTVPFYLELIGTERYGTLVILWSLMGYFGFMDLGLGSAVAQRLAAQGRSAYGRSGLVWTALIMTFALGVLAGLLLWLSADFMLTHWIKMSPQSLAEAISAIPWFVVAMPLMLSASVLTGALLGRKHFSALNVLGIISSTLVQVLPLIVATLGHTELDWLIPAVLSARLIAFVANFFYCRGSIPLRHMPHLHWAHLRPLLSYGGWVSLMTIVAPLLVIIDRLVIGSMVGVKAVAYYTVPYGIATQLTTLSGSLSGALFPHFAALTRQEAGELIDKASRTLLAFMVLAVLPGIALMQPFLILWVGSDIASKSWGVGEVILFGVLINCIVIPHHTYLMASGNARIVSGIYLVQLPFYFLLLGVGIQYFGVVGAAWAWAGRVLLDTVLQLRACCALGQALSYSYQPLLVGGAMLLISLEMSVNDPVRWYLSGLLLALSVWYEWCTLQGAVATLNQRRMAVS